MIYKLVFYNYFNFLTYIISSYILTSNQSVRSNLNTLNIDNDLHKDIQYLNNELTTLKTQNERYN